jgi:hypothetical protein
MQRRSSFGGAFDAAYALQVIISAAFRSGAPVSLDQTVKTILAKFPDCGMSRDELHKAALDAAEEAGVTVVGNEDGRSPRPLFSAL